MIQYILKNFYWKQDMIDLIKLFNELNNYEYFIIKIDTPYTPKTFPKEIPIGKDLDIFSSKKDFKNINKVLLDFANKYRDKFNIKVINQDYKYRVRLETFSKLYYQLDNNYLTDNNILSVFIENAMQKRIFINGYYTIPIEYEIVFRLSEIKNYPHKKYHIDFVKKYISKADISLIPENLIDIFKKIKEGKL